MCGIAGHFGPRAVPEDRVRRTLDLMRRRGPDHRASVTVRGPRSSATLLHARLSILDLDARSHQPMQIGPYRIVFNGEIYNYLELRRELEKEGERFRTDSDTEVLLKCFQRYGQGCVDRFEGMWSFAIHDADTETVFLSRDRIGEKPLFYLETEDGFFFASEPKALFELSGRRPKVDRQQIARYLVNGYKSLYKSEATFFEGLKELAPAHSMTWRPGSAPEIKRYWHLDAAPSPMSYEEAVAGVSERLEESLRLRLRADVPLAFCLSGGVDSSGLVSLAAKRLGCRVSTFSIVDEDVRYDETENILTTVRDLGCQNTLIRVSRTGFWERLSEQVRYHDAPVATLSYYVHEFLSEAIAAAGFKIAVSGSGADELFTGYFDHFNLFFYEMRSDAALGAHLAAWEKRLGAVVRNPHLRDPRLFIKDPSFRGHIYLDRAAFNGFLREPIREDFFEASYTTSLLRNRMMNELFHEVMPVILHEDDLNSMRYSVENRSPYLDRRLVEFAYRIPVEHLIRDGRGKSVLRDALKGTLNETVRMDAHKKGFNASILTLLDPGDPGVRARLAEDGPIFDIVDRRRFESMMEGDFTQNSFSKFLFSFISAKLFMEAYG